MDEFLCLYFCKTSRGHQSGSPECQDCGCCQETRRPRGFNACPPAFCRTVFLLLLRKNEHLRFFNGGGLYSYDRLFQFYESFNRALSKKGQRDRDEKDCRSLSEAYYLSIFRRISVFLVDSCHLGTHIGCSLASIVQHTDWKGNSSQSTFYSARIPRISSVHRSCRRKLSRSFLIRVPAGQSPQRQVEIRNEKFCVEKGSCCCPVHPLHSIDHRDVRGLQTDRLFPRHWHRLQ